MRVSTLSILALPLLVAAQQDPLEQVKAQAEYWFGKISSYIPNPSKAHTAADAATAKASGKTLNILTLNSWEHTIRSSVKPQSTTPEEWWVLVTGGNKTCFGLCGQVERSFNETAALWSANPTAPHLAYLNCENQPVLCNAWGAGPPSLWIMEVAALGNPVDVRVKGLNSTSTDVKTFTNLHATSDWKSLKLHDGYFHPFDGPLAQYGLAVPLGYLFWFFNIVPSWLFMILISFASRSFTSKRAVGTQPARPAAAAAAPRAR